MPPGQNDVSSDDVIFSRSPSPVSGVSLLIQADQPLTQGWVAAVVVVGTTLTVVGAGVEGGTAEAEAIEFERIRTGRIHHTFLSGNCSIKTNACRYYTKCSCGQTSQENQMRGVGVFGYLNTTKSNS